jgi:hypothetical protein
MSTRAPSDSYSSESPTRPYAPLAGQSLARCPPQHGHWQGCHDSETRADSRVNPSSESTRMGIIRGAIAAASGPRPAAVPSPGPRAPSQAPHWHPTPHPSLRLRCRQSRPDHDPSHQVPRTHRHHDHVPEPSHRPPPQSRVASESSDRVRLRPGGRLERNRLGYFKRHGGQL